MSGGVVMIAGTGVFMVLRHRVPFKVGPATAAIALHEADRGRTYRVARRPPRGLVKLTPGDLLGGHSRG